MGLIMVYRHRPMRVCPTITTSCAIVRGSFMRSGATLWAAARRVNRKNADLEG